MRVQRVIKAVDELEVESKQESGEQDLVSAMHDIISAITDSQDKLSKAVENGHKEVSLRERQADRRRRHAHVWRKKVCAAVASGSDQMSSSLESSHQEVATSVLRASDSSNDLAHVKKKRQKAFVIIGHKPFFIPPRNYFLPNEKS